MKGITERTFYGNERKIRALHGGRETIIYRVLKELLNNRFKTEDELRSEGILPTQGVQTNFAFRDIYKRGYIGRVKGITGDKLLYRYYLTPSGKRLYRKLQQKLEKEKRKLEKQIVQTNTQIQKAEGTSNSNTYAMYGGSNPYDNGSSSPYDNEDKNYSIGIPVIPVKAKAVDLKRLKALLQQLLDEINYLLEEE